MGAFATAGGGVMFMQVKRKERLSQVTPVRRLTPSWRKTPISQKAIVIKCDLYGHIKKEAA